MEVENIVLVTIPRSGEYNSREDVSERADDGLRSEGERLRALLGPVQHLQEPRVPVALQVAKADLQHLGDLQGTAFIQADRTRQSRTKFPSFVFCVEYPCLIVEAPWEIIKSGSIFGRFSKVKKNAIRNGQRQDHVELSYFRNLSHGKRKAKVD